MAKYVYVTTDDLDDFSNQTDEQIKQLSEKMETKVETLVDEKVASTPREELRIGEYTYDGTEEVTIPTYTGGATVSSPTPTLTMTKAKQTYQMS